MKRVSFSSLFVRFLLLVILAFIPALILIIYTADEQRQFEVTRAQEETMLLLRHVSGDQERLVDETHQFLAFMAQMPEVRSGDTIKCKILFKNLFEWQKRYANLGLISSDGDLLCSSVSLPNPTNFAESPSFIRALQTRDFSIGNYRLGPITGKPSIAFSYPVLNETGQVQAVLFASLDLTWVNNFVADVKLPPGVTFTMIDRNGTVLSRYPNVEQWIGKTMPETPIIQTILGQKGEGTVESVGIDGTPRLYAFKPLCGTANDADIYLYTGIPTDFIYAGAKRIVERNLTLLGIVTVLILVIAWLGGNFFISRHINTLINATKRLTAGDLSARTGLSHGPGEFGQLAHAFDHMARALEYNASKLRQSESDNVRQMERLSSLCTNTQKLVQNLDLQKLAGDIVSTCVKDFGVSMAWLGRAENDGQVNPLAHYPPECNFLDKVTVRWDESPLARGAVGRAIKTSSPVIIADISSDLSYHPWREEVLKRGFISANGLPLISRDKPFGGLLLYSDKQDFFTPERVELLQTYSHQAAAALENARLFEETRERFERLEALRNIDMAITASLDLRVTFNVVLDQVTNQLGVHAANILLLNPYTQTLEYAAGRGFRYKAIERSRLRLGEDYASRTFSEQRIISIPDLSEAGVAFLRIPLLDGEDFVTYYGVPLVAKGQVKGLLEIFHRAFISPNQEWLDFLETLARQAAIAIDNATMFYDLQRSNIELTLAYDATIEGWSRALDLRDKETEGHSQRVTEMSVYLARTMGKSEAELVHVRRGALLHDIGKMGVPDHILLKPGPLTEEEWVLMRLHPVYAYEMLSPIGYLQQALEIPYYHHEKWDGSGYPRGLKGEQIPLAARIFAVVDVWDALNSERPYRQALSNKEIKDYIQEQAGKHFEPQIVRAFFEMDWPKP